MATNRDWLFSKPFEEQVAWMNAERQDGTLDSDTAALNAKIAYPMHHGYKGVKADMVIFDELNDEHDSRDKLEADIRQYANPEGNTGTLGACWERKMFEFLDRQAAITEEKTRYKWVTASADEIAAWRSKAEKLKEQVYELTAERDELKAEIAKYEHDCELLFDEKRELTAERDKAREESVELYSDLVKASDEREHYREKFGKCIDYADAIHALMDDEGMA